MDFPIENGGSFHSYVSLPEGKPPFSYGFPIFLWVFLCFYGSLLHACIPLPTGLFQLLLLGATVVLLAGEPHR